MKTRPYLRQKGEGCRVSRVLQINDVPGIGVVGSYDHRAMSARRRRGGGFTPFHGGGSRFARDSVPRSRHPRKHRATSMPDIPTSPFIPPRSPLLAPPRFTLSLSRRDARGVARRIGNTLAYGMHYRYTRLALRLEGVGVQK